MQTHIKSCKLTETLKKWLTVDLKVDREPELKDRQRRRREDRDTRRLWTETVFVLGLLPWWVSILNLAEKKTREDGGSSLVGFDRWWVSIGGWFRYFLSDEEDENGDRRSVVKAPSESFDRSTVRFSFARRRTREKGERGEKKL
ncbi:hypothetical protein F2Q69_00050619 [Brassica cretica]|uniref:Uncharacterized protein n=1 Tax=Brassica cretica TaxID=69181 RepID=A0A8S9PQ16_BRACR|nr:hypothetical protein F2Q69_00050619 [Brassica cretica]